MTAMVQSILLTQSFICSSTTRTCYGYRMPLLKNKEAGAGKQSAITVGSGLQITLMGIRRRGLKTPGGEFSHNFRKMSMMLYQPLVLGGCKFCKVRARYIALHTLACFRLANRVSIPGHNHCRYVNRLKSPSCIIAEHPKHTSGQYSRRGLQLEAGYEIKFLPSFGAGKTAALGG